MRLKWINTVAFAAMIVINALTNLLPLAGYTTGQISELYPNLFTPAPLTFSIWGVIYLLTALFVIWQWEVFDKGRISAKVRDEIGPWFATSCVLNITWITMWHSRMIGLSVACMLLLLFSLVQIQKQLEPMGGTFPQRVAAQAGLSLYYGWIIAATIANISVWLTQLGWNGFGLPEDFWTAAVLLIGAGIASAVVLRGKNRIAGLAVMWAFGGVLWKQLSADGYNGTHPYVIATAVLSELIILAAMLLPLFRLSVTKTVSSSKAY